MSNGAGVPATANNDGSYNPRTLHRSVIAIPLLDRIRDAVDRNSTDLIDVVIDVNLNFPGGRSAAMEHAGELVRAALKRSGGTASAEQPVRVSGGYLAVSLPPTVIRDVVARDKRSQSIFHIWPDFTTYALLDKSLATVKADAAHASFSASGRGIVWAVMDTGVDISHSHFRRFGNTNVDPLCHRDFTGQGGETVDANGHGTHVAGIIGGYQQVPASKSLGALNRSETWHDPPSRRK